MPPKTLFEWCSAQQKWQQDAIRRLAVYPELSEADIADILANLKQENGIPREGDLTCNPVLAEHLKPTGAAQPKTLLCSLEPVEHVNRLANGQVLPFGIDGMTIVYGHNGTGKSGYARIAKKLCRAKVVDGILPNVFEQGKFRKAKVNVRYKIDGEEEAQSVVWQDGETGPDATAHISVFDSVNARLYVDENNQIDYLPYELEILERHAALLSQLRTHIDSELGVIEPQLFLSVFEATAGTAVHKLLGKLNDQASIASLPSEKEIKELASWTDDDMAKLNSLDRVLKNDPVVAHARSVRISTALEATLKRLAPSQEALVAEKAIALQMAFETEKTASNVARLAAVEMFKDYPLDHIGADPWRQMFEYAKAYSTRAYPDVVPPATRLGDVCVLCQQPLDESARKRLEQFEAFVSGQAQKDADTARSALDKLASDLKELAIPSASEIRNALAELRDTPLHKGVVEQLADFVESANARRNALVKAADSGDFENVPELDASPVTTLVKAQTTYQQQVKTLEIKKAEAPQFAIETSKDRQQRDELRDRHLLCKNVDHVLSRRNNLEMHARLQACSRALDTSAVSRQVNALRTELVTDELRERIQNEIDYLDLSYLPITLKERSRKGESLVGVSLGTKVTTNNSNILSEGEQRALALACFLADVNGQPTQHGIIIDDPVSSLDHLRIRKFARRLVNEAATGRQVIVFTHSLQFFAEVADEAASRPKPVKVVTHCLRKSEAEGFGLVHTEDKPWEAKPINKRIEHLLTKLKRLENVDDTEAPEYRDAVVDFYTNLRETWERLVEEVLFAKTVERFGPGVKTQSLRGVTVQDDDYRTIYWAMTRVSERSGHDMATGRDIPLPKLDEMRDDLKTLDEYRATVRKRNTQLQKERQKLEKPPKATLV